jgi:hypothetical protein
VISVDGVEADESNLIKLIQGNNVVGSPCTLGIVRSRGIGNHSSSAEHANSGQASVQAAEVNVSIVAARDLPNIHQGALTDPFVCLSIMDRPTITNSQADIDQNLVELDHLMDDSHGKMRYSWRRSESGRHFIKQALLYQPDTNSRLEPLVRTRVLEHTLDPHWDETFVLRQAYTDPVAHQEQYMSLECCPKSNVHGQDLMALVTLHGRTLRSPSSKNRGEGVDDGWCGRLMVPNIRAGQSIDGWFPLEQTDGSPVIGSNISYLYMAMRTCQCQRYQP